jgi:hypothetical protein
LRDDLKKKTINFRSRPGGFDKNVKAFTGSKVQGFRGSRFHSRRWTIFGMRIYEKSVSFVRPNPKFGAKGLRVFNAFFALNPER